MDNKSKSLYNKKTAFYESIRTGNIDMAKANLIPLCGEEDTRYNKDDLVNLKYHFVIAVSMMARFCFEGGMPSEEVCAMEDKYIEMADASDNMEEIQELHTKAMEEFCNCMYEMRFRGINSVQVINAIKFINSHIDERITLTVVAEHLGITMSHLSHIFKNATGEKISKYILIRKLDASLVMLKNTKLSVSEISYRLKFTSQSYFTKTFKKILGISPRQYRSGKFTISPDALACIKSPFIEDEFEFEE